MPDFVSFLVSSILGGSIVSAVGKVVLEGWKDRATARFDNVLEQRMASLNHELEKQLTLFSANRNWKEQALVEFYGPLMMQFDRTKRAFKRYRDTDLFLEAEVLKRSNEFIRDLLLTKGHYLSADLIDHAGQLIEHYGVWLAEYDRVRKLKSPDLAAKFVYAGPQGYRFPSKSEQALRDSFGRLCHRFQALQQDLYPGL